MKRWMMLGIVSLVMPVLSAAVERTGWWVVRMERCELDYGEPVQMIEAMKTLGWSFQMKDREEQGTVVETTMIIAAWTRQGLPPLTWYRTRERCETALQKQQEAKEPARRQREQERAKLQERYR